MNKKKLIKPWWIIPGTKDVSSIISYKIKDAQKTIDIIMSLDRKSKDKNAKHREDV